MKRGDCEEGFEKMLEFRLQSQENSGNLHQKVTNEDLLNYKEHLEKLVNERTREINLLNQELVSINQELQVSNCALLETNESLAAQKVELENAYLKLKLAQEKLIHSEKMASLGVLTAGLAHEINNPINFISSNIHALRDLTEEILIHAKSGLAEDFNKTKSTLEELFTHIDTGVSRTTSVISSLRYFGYSNHERKEFTDLNKLLESTLVILRSQYKNRIVIHKNLEDIPKVECTPGRISQIFMNLLSNAIQSIEKNGEIWITSNSNSGNNKVEFSIRDNGSGMDDETLRRIYDPFFTTKKIGEGTGLGLSIVYGIIEESKGSIHVESEPGKGSCFHFELPVTNK